MIKKTLPNKEETFGEYSHEVADAHKLLGNIYLCLGEHSKALKDFKKVCITLYHYSFKSYSLNI